MLRLNIDRHFLKKKIQNWKKTKPHSLQKCVYHYLFYVQQNYSFKNKKYFKKGIFIDVHLKIIKKKFKNEKPHSTNAYFYCYYYFFYKQNNSNYARMRFM